MCVCVCVRERQREREREREREKRERDALCIIFFNMNGAHNSIKREYLYITHVRAGAGGR